MMARRLLLLAVADTTLAMGAMRGAHETIVVTIYNAQAVPPMTLNTAKEIAAFIFSKAGVDLVWGNPNGSANDSYRLQMLTVAPRNLGADAAGFSVLMPETDGRRNYAGISYSAVAEAANSLNADPANLLGAAIAHEVGHMLLGAGAHSPSGVMTPRLRAHEAALAGRGQLLFTPGQARQIRERARQRKRE
jgi:hypothetical protein